MHRLLPLLALTALSCASAEVRTEWRLPAGGVFAGEAVTVTFVLWNLGPQDVLFTRQNCRPELAALRFPGGQNMIRDEAESCIGATPPIERVRPGFRREIALRLLPLPAGDYVLKTNFLPGPGPAARAPKAELHLRVGPGPLVASLALSAPARAGRPVPLVTQYRNISPGVHREDLRPCGRGLQIRNVNGRVVYDTLPEHAACKTDLRPTTLQPGQTHAEPWPRLPTLPAGDYTAVMWGTYHGSLRFTVGK